MLLWSSALANKRVLQAAIVASLLLISALCEWQLTSRSWSLMRGALLEQSLAGDAATAGTVAGVLQQTAPGGSVRSPEGRRYAQRLVEHLDLGAGTYALLVDRGGVVLADPVAAYVGAPIGATVLLVNGRKLALAQALHRGESVRGWAADPTTGQRRLVAAYWSPAMQAAVCVFQSPALVARRTHELSTFFLRSTFLLWAALLVAVWFIVGALVDQYESRAAALARTDTLTGLGNRRVLDEVLAAAAARQRNGGRGLAAIAVDLDDFKLINDRHGHAAGDRALQALAQALRRIARDHAFRLGGDEFLVLVDDATEDHADRELEHVRGCFPLSVPCDNGRELLVEGSAGYAHWEPGQRLDRLLPNADQALYLNKSIRKNAQRKANAFPRARLAGR